MHFTSPLWLFAFLPWAGMVLWLLWGRRRKTPVAFLDLWKGPALQKPAKRALQPPPVFLGLAILAILMALLAAAKPRAFQKQGAAVKPITIVVDRGMSMSAMSAGRFRFQLAAKHAGEELPKAAPDATPVELIVVPGNGAQATNLDSWAARVAGLSPTALDTQALLNEAVRGRLADAGGAVVVISDRRLGFDDPRLVQFSAPAVENNIAVLRIAAREMPDPQVMVSIQNDSDRQSIGVKVRSGSQAISQTVDLPSRGQARDYFFDFLKLDETIDASLDARDDQPADDHAWLVREGRYPKIEARSAISAEVARMIQVYGRSRPATDESPTVALVGAEADLPADKPAVWIAPATGPSVHGVISAVAHPVTADVNWPAFPGTVQIAGEPRGWTPLVSIDGHVIVAARSEPSRKVWVGFESSAFAATPDFVVFWANVFAWTGQGQERFAAYPLEKYEPGWELVELAPAPQRPTSGQWPGLYRTDEGRIRAYNSTANVRAVPAAETPAWRERVVAAEGTSRAGYNLSSPLLVLAIFGLTGAALTWKRRSMAERALTPVSAGRNF